MLVLALGPEEKIDIIAHQADNIVITYCGISKQNKNKILIGFEAPRSVDIVRQNAVCKTKKGNKDEN